MTSRRSRTIAMGGEQSAARYLEGRGYRILARNWRSGRHGEIDLVAKTSDGLIVFVEVKTRTRDSIEYGIPDQGFQAVNGLKQRRLVRLARSYLSRVLGKASETNVPCRLDVIVVSVAPDFSTSAERGEAGRTTIVHVENAFAG